jgi:hypothetical protein
MESQLTELMGLFRQHQLAQFVGSSGPHQQAPVIPQSGTPRRAMRTPASAPSSALPSASARLQHAVGLVRPPAGGVPLIPRPGQAPPRPEPPLVPAEIIDGDEVDEDSEDHDEPGDPDDAPKPLGSPVADDRHTMPGANHRVTADGKYVERSRSAAGVCALVRGPSGIGTWAAWLARKQSNWGTRNINEALALCHALDSFMTEGVNPETSDGFETLVCRFLAIEAMEKGQPSTYVNALLWSPHEPDTLIPRSLDREARTEAILVDKLQKQKSSHAKSMGGGGSGGKQKNKQNKNKGGDKKPTDESKRTGKSSGAPSS